MSSLSISLKGPHSADESRILARGRNLQASAYSVMHDVRSANLWPSDSVHLAAEGSNPQLSTYAYEGAIGTGKFNKAQVWFYSDGAIESFTASKGPEFLVHELVPSSTQGLKDQLYIVPGETYLFTKNGTLLYTGL